MGISRGFGLIAGIISSTATGFLISQVGQFIERLQVAGIVLGTGDSQQGLCSPRLCGQTEMASTDVNMIILFTGDSK